MRGRGSRSHHARARAALAACFFLLVLAVGGRAGAQDRPARLLSLAEAMALADTRSPDVVLAVHALRGASARRVGAGVVMPTNPRISADARPPITGGTLHDLGYSSILETAFEVGGAPHARVREADRYADLARADLALQKARARFAAWEAYVRAQVAEQRIGASRAAAEIAKRIVDASKQRADLGAAGDIEQALASSDAAQIDAQTSQARREHEAHLMDLRDVLDLPADEPLALTTTLGEPDVPPATDALVARALSRRPELAVIRRRIDLLDATEKRLERETFPRVGFYGGVDAAPVSPIFGVLGVTIELPVAQRNQGPRAVTRAARDGEASRLDLITRRISREVAASRNAFDARRAELELLTTRALPTAERTLELVETGWKSGRFDIFRVATAARDVARVRSLRIDAFEAAWLGRIAVERATGGAGGGQ